MISRNDFKEKFKDLEIPTICRKLVWDKETKNDTINLTNYLPNSSVLVERVYHIMNDLYERPKCKMCLNYVTFRNSRIGYSTYCSNKCTGSDPEFLDKVRNTNKETYKNNYKNIRDKMDKTNLKKYGTTKPNDLKEIRDAIENTMLEKYGVRFSHQNPDILAKVIKTNLNRYDVKWTSQSDDVKKKIVEAWANKTKDEIEEISRKRRKTNKERYDVDNPGKRLDFLKLEERKEEFLKILYQRLNEMGFELLDEYIDNITNHRWKCNTCDSLFTENWRNMCRGYLCPICYPRNKDSKSQKEISDFIISLGFEIIKNDNDQIKPYEIDIYIPYLKLGIEVNGLYWHSELYHSSFSHLNKTKMCENKGISLIQIFEDEWIFKPEVVKYRLKSILNKDNLSEFNEDYLEIKEIDNDIKDNFLRNYHLDPVDNSMINLASFYNSELIGIMTFDQKDDNGSYRINRFCTNYDYNSKEICKNLVNYFKRKYNCQELVKYEDRRWSNGELYYDLGFRFISNTEPQCWNIDGINRIRNYESEDNNLLRIYDCGKIKLALED